MQFMICSSFFNIALFCLLTFTYCSFVILSRNPLKHCLNGKFKCSWHRNSPDTRRLLESLLHASLDSESVVNEPIVHYNIGK